MGKLLGIGILLAIVGLGVSLGESKKQWAIGATVMMVGVFAIIVSLINLMPQ